jgi:hypothetical protein
MSKSLVNKTKMKSKARVLNTKTRKHTRKMKGGTRRGITKFLSNIYPFGKKPKPPLNYLFFNPQKSANVAPVQVAQEESPYSHTSSISKPTNPTYNVLQRPSLQLPKLNSYESVNTIQQMKKDYTTIIQNKLIKLHTLSKKPDNPIRFLNIRDLFQTDKYIIDAIDNLILMQYQNQEKKKNLINDIIEYKKKYIFSKMDTYFSDKNEILYTSSFPCSNYFGGYQAIYNLKSPYEEFVNFLNTELSIKLIIPIQVLKKPLKYTNNNESNTNNSILNTPRIDDDTIQKNIDIIQNKLNSLYNIPPKYRDYKKIRTDFQKDEEIKKAIMILIRNDPKFPRKHHTTSSPYIYINTLVEYKQKYIFCKMDYLFSHKNQILYEGGIPECNKCFKPYSYQRINPYKDFVDFLKKELNINLNVNLPDNPLQTLSYA